MDASFILFLKWKCVSFIMTNSTNLRRMIGAPRELGFLKNQTICYSADNHNHFGLLQKTSISLFLLTIKRMRLT